MPAPLWQVEFDRAAARELRKLGAEAERRVLGFLRERRYGTSALRGMGGVIGLAGLAFLFRLASA